jgi:hypothetical protein
MGMAVSIVTYPIDPQQVQELHRRVQEYLGGDNDSFFLCKGQQDVAGKRGLCHARGRVGR